MRLRLRQVAPHERLGEHEPALAPPSAKSPSTTSGSASIGFSHSTCRPASSAARAHGACSPFGVDTYTASTPSSASSSS